MRIFNEPNVSNGWKCPICGSGEIKSVTLIGIHGTQENGVIEAEQYHVDCLELTQMSFGDDLVLMMRFKDARS